MSKQVLPPILSGLSRVERNKKKQATRVRPKAHEKAVALALSARRQPGSGAFDDYKGDVRADAHGLLVECKRTHEKKSLRVEVEWLSKITREAHAQGLDPALSFEFDREVTSQLPGTPEHTWVAVPLNVMRRLLEQAGIETKL